MAEIELGNGLPDVRTTKQTDAALAAAGFEVLDTRDLALDADIPWWDPVDPDSWRLGSEWRLGYHWSFQIWAGFSRGSQRSRDVAGCGRLRSGACCRAAGGGA
jgi:hypothetical protein